MVHGSGFMVQGERSRVHGYSLPTLARIVLTIEVRFICQFILQYYLAEIV